MRAYCAPPAILPSLQSYTCRELLCIVFLPCLLISILGIVCSGLAIHHHLAQVSAVEQRSPDPLPHLDRDFKATLSDSGFKAGITVRAGGSQYHTSHPPQSTLLSHLVPGCRY